jgi:hypothetical protein
MANKFSIAAMFLLLSQISFSQSDKYYSLPKPFYKNAKITLKDFSKYEVTNLKIEADTVFFMDKLTQSNNILMIDKIDYIRVQEGNQAIKWAGLGGLLFGLIAVSNVYNVPEDQRLNDQGKIIIGFTISGTLIGGLVGLAIPRWKTYYPND